MYNKPDSNIHEHILLAINVLIDDNPESIKQAKEMKEINFKQILSERIDLISSDPRHQVIARNFFIGISRFQSAVKIKIALKKY